jgi:hypothetical protein
MLVDVDGVISLFGFKQGSPPPGRLALVEGLPHLLSVHTADRLRGLSDRYDCAWCTGWEERADEHLPALLGLPRGWPFVRFVDAPALAAHWKLAGIDAFAGRSRPLAWIDDAHDDDCRAWAAARPGATLLVSTEPDVGLTEDQGAVLRRWSRAIRSGSCG